MFYLTDPQTGYLVWCCPQCKALIHSFSPLPIRLAEQGGGCQGCRAQATLKQNPGLVSFFMDFWTRADAWPQSASWIEAIPVTA